jgi:hypothetical protein
MITSTLTADRPRGKNQRERWYRDHARAAETLFVIELPNGALSDASIRVADTPVRLSQIKVPAVQTADGPVPVTVLPEPEADREETSPRGLDT